MRTVRKIIWREIQPHIWQLGVILFLMLCTAGLEAISPWPFKFLIDNVLGDEVIDKKTLIGMLFAMFPSQEALGYFVVFAFFAISFSLSFLEYYRSLQVKQVIKSIVFNFAKKAFSNMETFDIGFFRKQDVGDYIYRLSYDVSALGEMIEEGMLPLITSGLYLLFTTTIMFTISVRLTLISLTVLPFLAAGLYFFNRKIVIVTKRSEYWNSTVFSFVQQTLSQLKIIQAFSQEQKESGEFNQKMGTSLKTDFRLYRLNFLLSLLVGVIIAVSYSFIIAIGIRYFFAGELTTGLLIIFIFYLDNLTNPLLNIIYASSMLRETYVRVGRMKDFFIKKSHTYDSGSLITITDPRIQFENVNLKGSGDVSILRNVSCTFEAGKLTVLVGVSGSGKTSLISLIPRLINDPTKGKIFINGRDFREYTISALRHAIAFVPQENNLFNETIYDIISYGDPNSSMKDVREAAKLAMADEFIHEHPSGYHFRVGEDGNYLSGGQRQRLMLARAFMKKDAKILIFDEPLSSLDIVTRTHIWKRIREFSHGKTTIIVSNVLDVISNADHIIFINKGQIEEAGKHIDLLKKSNLYNIIIEGS